MPIWAIDEITRRKLLKIKLVFWKWPSEGTQGLTAPSTLSAGHWDIKLGRALGSYINKSQGCYDHKFEAQIKAVAPTWFIDAASANKKRLMEMARQGEPKPHWKHALGVALKNYLSEHRGCYDQAFKDQVKKLAPQWFVVKPQKQPDQNAA